MRQTIYRTAGMVPGVPMLLLGSLAIYVDVAGAIEKALNPNLNHIAALPLE
jgi:hypothetical protein